MKDRKENDAIKRFVETIVYTLACLASFGAVWLLKIVIKRAVNESK